MLRKVIIASHYPFYNKHGMYFTRIYHQELILLELKQKKISRWNVYKCRRAFSFNQMKNTRKWRTYTYSRRGS